MNSKSNESKGKDQNQSESQNINENDKTEVNVVHEQDTISNCTLDKELSLNSDIIDNGTSKHYIQDNSNNDKNSNNENKTSIINVPKIQTGKISRNSNSDNHVIDDTQIVESEEASFTDCDNTKLQVQLNHIQTAHQQELRLKDQEIMSLKAKYEQLQAQFADFQSQTNKKECEINNSLHSIKSIDNSVVDDKEKEKEKDRADKTD
eukprot:CAMPEP_0116916686 /NCGR_PEP_ID=MMETSP0467-20121206/18682_1 /TAXON_ID=283647 /ORGANISM="Mesodinium pulex, Strain SPMC105" /LENGTH=205 /DNA_ID=CAMNT_0004593609 /DNA_START=639 /DNA_END=1256 /DNA_ORIENTATION=+